MKAFKIVCILIGTMFGVFAASCTKLDVPTHGELTEENLEPTEETIARLVGPVYTRLRWYNEYFGYVPMQEGAGDSYVTPIGTSSWAEIPPHFFYISTLGTRTTVL